MDAVVCKAHLKKKDLCLEVLQYTTETEVTSDRMRGNGLKLCQGGLDWILGNFSLLKEWSGSGTGCPGKWLSHHPWTCSEKVQMWHFGIWFSRHGGVAVMVGLDDLRGLFQPMIL